MKAVSSLAVLLGMLALVVPLLWSVPAQAQAELGGQEPDHEFTIAVGETLTFSGRNVHRIVHGDSSVARAEPSANNQYLFVSGESPGVATIVFFTGGGDDQQTLMIRVVGVNPTSLAEEVRDVLGERAGVDIRVVKGRVLIEGEVSSQVFQDKIERLTELYPDQVLNFSTFREAFVEGARMVAMEVYFIQLATTRQDSLGVRWNQFIGGNYAAGTGDVPLFYEQGELGPGVLPGGGEQPPRPLSLTGGEGLTSYSSLVGNLNFALDFLVEQGMIKTIQQATLVTEAGTEAEYVAGGNIVIPIRTQTTTTVQERPFGLVLRMTPILDFENQVKLEIDMSYSEVDFALGVGDYPGFRSNDVTSTVNMQEGQSVLISAQENVDNTSTERGFSILNNIPILGWAFKSRNYISEELNNALFITPRVYEPGSSGHRTMVQGVFQNLLDAGANADDLPELEDAD